MQIVGKNPDANVSLRREPLLIHSADKPVKVLPIKKIRKKNILNRFSPFLLLAFVMPVLFVYSLLIRQINAADVLTHLFLLVFLEINILFADFAIWKYFHHKKVIAIWIAESIVATAIIYFMI